MMVAQRANDCEAGFADARILVVEDEFLVALEIESVLHDAGVKTVLLCRNVSDAVAQAGRADITAAILDVRVENELISPVARQLTRRGIPFLFYTADPKADPLAAEWPGRTIVAKPADACTITKALAAIL
jgi:DNA-binding response OmpR family regulator